MNWYDKLLCNKLNTHKLVTLAYGYPANDITWLTLKMCKRCGFRIFEWDDLFMVQRSYSQLGISRMNVDVNGLGFFKERYNVTESDARELIKHIIANRKKDTLL